MVCVHAYLHLFPYMHVPCFDHEWHHLCREPFGVLLEGRSSFLSSTFMVSSLADANQALPLDVAIPPWFPLLPGGGAGGVGGVGACAPHFAQSFQGFGSSLLPALGGGGG